MVKVTKHPEVKDEGLGEIYQSVELRMALVTPQDGGYARITQFVKCRDFLVDVYTFDEVDRKFEIYSMVNPPVKPPRDSVILLLKFPSAKVLGDFQKNIVRIVHAVEKQNGLPETSVQEVEGDELQRIIIGDKFWLTSCLTLSLYSSLVRTSCHPLGDGNWIDEMRAITKDYTDAKLVDSITQETWDRILKDLSILKMPTFCGFDAKGADEYTIHHNSGFYSVFGNHRELSLQSVHGNTHWQHFYNEKWSLYPKTVKEYEKLNKVKAA